MHRHAHIANWLCAGAAVAFGSMAWADAPESWPSAPTDERFVLLWADALMCLSPTESASCIQMSDAPARGEGARHAMAWQLAGWRGDWVEVVSSTPRARADAPEERARHCHARPQGGVLGQAELHLFARKADTVPVLTEAHAINVNDGTAVILLPGTAWVEATPSPDGVPRSSAGAVFSSADHLEVPLVAAPPVLARDYGVDAPRPSTHCEGDDECGVGSLCVDQRCRPEPASVVDYQTPLLVGRRAIVRTAGKGPRYVAKKSALPDDPSRSLVGIEGRCVVVRAVVPSSAIGELRREPEVLVLRREAVAGPGGTRRVRPGDAVVKAGARLSWPDGSPAGSLLAEWTATPTRDREGWTCFDAGVTPPSTERGAPEALGVRRLLEVCAPSEAVQKATELPTGGGLFRK